MNQIASFGGWAIGASYALFLYNMIKSAMFGKASKSKGSIRIRNTELNTTMTTHDETHITRTSPQRFMKGLIIIIIPLIFLGTVTITQWENTASIPPPVSAPPPAPPPAPVNAPGAATETTSSWCYHYNYVKCCCTCFIRSFNLNSCRCCNSWKSVLCSRHTNS